MNIHCYDLFSFIRHKVTTATFDWLNVLDFCFSTLQSLKIIITIKNVNDTLSRSECASATVPSHFINWHFTFHISYNSTNWAIDVFAIADRQNYVRSSIDVLSVMLWVCIVGIHCICIYGERIRCLCWSRNVIIFF